jgi:hypothetical protein
MLRRVTRPPPLNASARLGSGCATPSEYCSNHKINTPPGKAGSV